MPIYEYECPSCGVMEVTQRITDKALAKCPQCKRRKVKKLISNTSFQLKGSGWYVTDYGGKKGSDSSSDSTASTETKSDKSDASTGKEAASGKKEGGKKSSKKDGKAAA